MNSFVRWTDTSSEGGNDDDASWHSADAMLDLLEKNSNTPPTSGSVPPETMIIDIRGRKGSYDADGIDDDAPGLTAMLWDDNELHRLHDEQEERRRAKSDPHYNASHNDYHHIDVDFLTDDDDDKEEDNAPDLVEEDEYATPNVKRSTLHTTPVTQAGHRDGTTHHHQQPMDSVGRILAFLHYTEPNRELVHQAQEIVRECHWESQHGRKRKYKKNLSGAIFEEFVKLFGGLRFQEVYQNALRFDFDAAERVIASRRYQQSQQSHGHHHQHAHTPMMAHPSQSVTMSATGDHPGIVDIAIAYGMHMVRLDQMENGSTSKSPGSSKSRKEVVQEGAEKFHSMTNAERQMFWEYSTSPQQL